MRHPKHKSLYFDEANAKWEISCKREKSTGRCCAPWCRNPPYCFYPPSGNLFTDRFCSKCRSRKWRANNPIRYAFSAIKGSAKKRNISFDIKFEEFKDWCEKTGYASNKGIARLTDHCDRIDDDLGYEINNIQILSQGDNVRKQRERENQTNEDPF